MAGWSDSRENAWLDHILRGSAVTSPTNAYVGLHNGDPGETGANELSGGSYTRLKAGDTGVTDFAAASNRATSNVGELRWAQATTDYGTVSHVSIWDSLTTGTLLYVGPLDSAIAIGIGATPVLSAGALNVVINDRASVYLANKILDHDLRNTAYTPPTNTYLSLHDGDPGGTGLNEIAGNAYARQQLGSGGDSEFSAAVSGATDNDSEIAFPQASGGAWGVLSWFGFWDASTSGNFLLKSQLSPTRTVNENDQLTFAAGDLDVSAD